MNSKIQLLRGLAIFAVVLIHNNGEGLIAVLNRPFINYAVAMFIFLSGYLTNQDIKDYKKFYFKRIIRVLIPYVIWTCLYTIVDRSPEDLIRNLLTGEVRGPFYYILVYIQLTLLTPLTIKLAKSRFRWIGWMISPVYLLIVRYICTFMEIPLGFPFPETIFLGWYIYYYLGFLLKNNYIQYDLKYAKTLSLYAVSMVISMIEGFVWFHLGDFDLATTQLRLSSLLSSVFACLLAYEYIANENVARKKASKTIQGIKQGLICLGNHSFGIYLSHVAVMGVLAYIPGYSSLFFVAKFVIVLFTTLMCTIIGEKILGAKFSRYIGLR